MKYRIQTRTLTSYFLTILFCIAVLILLSQILLNPLFFIDSRRQMMQLGKRIEQGMKEEEYDVDALLDGYHDTYLFHVLIMDDQQDILYSTFRMPILRKNSRRWAILSKVMDEYPKDDYTPSVKMTTLFDKKEYLVYFHRLQDGKIILIANSREGIRQNAHMIRMYLVLAGILLAAAGGIVLLIMTRPYSRMEEDMSEMQIELERRRNLVRNLAHEIRTPLTTIQGYAENLQIVASDNEKAVRYGHIMVEECEVLNRLSEEMLDVSSLERGNPLYQMKELQTGELFKTVRNRVSAEYPDRELTVQIEEACIHGIEELLIRVVMNYLRNAFRYGREGTPVELTGKKEKGHYRIEVINAGEPIPEKEQLLIWDAFYKSDPARIRGGGYGVGLTIVREIAKMHHAKYGVRSENGKNSFFFLLPM